MAVNTHDFRAAGFRQVGAKRGKIGHPLPGVSVRIVDPDTLQPLPVGQPGLLLVRGPNVMQGYLGQPGKDRAKCLRDGWYVTGDIAALDEDGFLQITDRLSRFSKIGGEMVPHIKVEEKLHELAGATEQTFVVTGVPDEKKGERLVVLHKLAPEQAAGVPGEAGRSATCRTSGSRAPTSSSTSTPCPTSAPASWTCAKRARSPPQRQILRPDLGPAYGSWSRFCSETQDWPGPPGASH